MINTKTYDISTYHIYTGNLSRNYTLILGGGPSTKNKKYIEQLASLSPLQNFILVEYSFKLTAGFNLDYLIDEIVNITSSEQAKIETVIGFSFGSYVALRVVPFLPWINTLILGGFLSSYEQLERAREKIDFDITHIGKENADLYLMGISFKDMEEKMNLHYSVEDKKLQDYFENNRYFETDTILSSKLKDKKFIFLVNEDDKLTPKENVYDFIKQISTNGKGIDGEILIKDGPHSLSSHLKDISKLLPSN